MTTRPIIHLIDDDESVLHSLSSLVETIGHECRCFDSAEAFLVNLPEEKTGCVITDLQMDGINGIELQQELLSKNSPLPLIIVSGKADVESAVELMENGAVTLLKKPYQHQQLISAIDKALTLNARILETATWIQSVLSRIDNMSEDEVKVMDFIVDGTPNKTIAKQLNISMRTVDRRRSSVLGKMEVKSAPELAQLITRLKLSEDPNDNNSDEDD
jgi:two-component system, LuxR family, response regulator FixJ